MHVINAGGVAAAAAGATKQFWIPVTEGSEMTYKVYFPVCRLNASLDWADISFFAPDDFTSITEAYIVVIPNVTQAAANWDLFSNYGAAGEAYNTHTQTNLASTYNVTVNQIFKVDISGILTSLSAGDYVGVSISLYTADPGLDVLGVMFKYS